MLDGKMLEGLVEGADVIKRMSEGKGFRRRGC